MLHSATSTEDSDDQHEGQASGKPADVWWDSGGQFP